jgi:hypothetical protein
MFRYKCTRAARFSFCEIPFELISILKNVDSFSFKKSILPVTLVAFPVCELNISQSRKFAFQKLAFIIKSRRTMISSISLSFVFHNSSLVNILICIGDGLSIRIQSRSWPFGNSILFWKWNRLEYQWKFHFFLVFSPFFKVLWLLKLF